MSYGVSWVQITIKPLVLDAPNPDRCVSSRLAVVFARYIEARPVLSREWRSSWSSADRRCSNYIWVINYSIAYQGVVHIRGLTVFLMFYIGHCNVVLTHWCRGKMATIFADILKNILVNENSHILIQISLKYFVSKVQWTVSHHWFKLLGAEQATSHVQRWGLLKIWSLISP